MKRDIPFGMKNYILFLCGVLAIVLGYYLLSIGPWDSIWSLYLAPVILVIGYVVILPLSIMKKFDKKQ